MTMDLDKLRSVHEIEVDVSIGDEGEGVNKRPNRVLLKNAFSGESIPYAQGDFSDQTLILLASCPDTINFREADRTFHLTGGRRGYVNEDGKAYFLLTYRLPTNDD